MSWSWSSAVNFTSMCYAYDFIQAISIVNINWKMNEILWLAVDLFNVYSISKFIVFVEHDSKNDRSIATHELNIVYEFVSVSVYKTLDILLLVVFFFFFFIYWLLPTNYKFINCNASTHYSCGTKSTQPTYNLLQFQSRYVHMEYTEVQAKWGRINIKIIMLHL